MPNSDIQISLIQVILNDAKNGGFQDHHLYIPWKPIIAMNILTKIRHRFLREDSWNRVRSATCEYRKRSGSWQQMTESGIVLL